MHHFSNLRLAQAIAAMGLRFEASAFWVKTAFSSDRMGQLVESKPHSTPHNERRSIRFSRSFLYHGTMDEIVSTEHLPLYAKAVPHATLRLLENRDHQRNDDLSDVARNIHHALPSR